MMTVKDIEKLAYTERVKPGPQVDQRILRAAGAALDRAPTNQATVTIPRFSRIVLHGSLTKTAVAAALVAAFILLASLLMQEWRDDSQQAKGPSGVNEPSVAQKPLSQHNQELARAQQLYEQRDMTGLLRLLANGRQDTKTSVAGYLGEIGDDSALPILQSFADTWDGPSDNNPFIRAINEIQNRLRQNSVQPNDVNTAKDLIYEDTHALPILALSDLDEDNDQEGVLGLKVVDKHTGSSVAGASLEITLVEQSSTYQVQTNQFGRLALHLPEEQPHDLYITVRQHEYVTTQLQFHPRQTGVPIPLNYLLRLEKGLTVSGVVRTQDGQPVRDAIVSVGVPQTRWQGLERQIVNETCATNAQGRWRCPRVPLSASQAYISLNHPEYIIDSGSRASIESLLTGSHILTVWRGLDISGCVTDEAGRPVPDAQVYLGNHAQGEARAFTDAQGLFKISRLGAERQLIGVIADGYAQDMQAIQVHQDMQPVVFALKPGYAVTARVVDRDSQPISGALIKGKRWRRVPRHGRTENIRLSALSDTQGMVVLEDAPRDEALYTIAKAGYATISSFPMSPQDTPYQIVLIPVGTLTGQVFDSQTRQPIRDFCIRPGIAGQADGEPVWQGPGQLMHTGQFNIPLQYERMAVHITAEGYLPAQTSVYVNDGGVHECDVYLNQSFGTYGTVYLPEGTPARGVDILVATEDRPVRISGMTFDRNVQHHVTTDNNGFFLLPPIAEPFRLMLLHPQGVADIDGLRLETGAEIVLQPWGRIEAHMVLDPSNTHLPEVALHMPLVDFGGPNIKYVRESSVDQQGHVTFDRVCPGQLKISQGMRQRDGSIDWTHPQYIEVQPGETVQVDLTVKGRHVEAQLGLTQDRPIDLAFAEVHLKSLVDLRALDLPTITLPEDLFDTVNDFWMMQNDYARAIRARLELWVQLERLYSAPVDADGIVHFTDVMPGRYNLTALIKDARSQQRFGIVLPEIHIPELSPKGVSHLPIQLGTINMLPWEQITLGNPAPDFELEDFKGDPIRLDDYQGKFLLIETGGPLSEDNYVQDTLPLVQAVHRAFRDTGPLDILSVSPAWSIGTLDLRPQFEYLATAHDITWKLAKPKRENLGELTPMLGQYCHRFVLVGPDATVIALIGKDQAGQLTDIVDRAISGSLGEPK